MARRARRHREPARPGRTRTRHPRRAKNDEHQRTPTHAPGVGPPDRNRELPAAPRRLLQGLHAPHGRRVAHRHAPADRHRGGGNPRLAARRPVRAAPRRGRPRPSGHGHRRADEPARRRTRSGHPRRRRPLLPRPAGLPPVQRRPDAGPLHPHRRRDARPEAPQPRCPDQRSQDADRKHRDQDHTPRETVHQRGGGRLGGRHPEAGTDTSGAGPAGAARGRHRPRPENRERERRIRPQPQGARQICERRVMRRRFVVPRRLRSGR